MKIKVNVLVITIILTIIVFGISTYMQKKLIDYEATISCLVLTKDITENELLSEEKFKIADIPISIVANQKVVTDFREIEGLYSKDNIKKGQIAVKSQFDTKENLSIYEAEEGFEKISIKVKSAENGVSFQIKEKSLVNVYATLENEFANNFMLDSERLMFGNEYDGYTVIKILENIEVLGVFTSDGVEYDKVGGDNIDSILVAVNPEQAKQINLIRDIASFNITGVNNKIKEEQVELYNNFMESGDSYTVSGDEV